MKKRPVAVALAADMTLFFYRWGVYDPWFCGHIVNHAVLAVGYDFSASKPYFNIKNSWGWLWGHWGYFKIAMGKTPQGVCNIAGSGKNFFPVL